MATTLTPAPTLIGYRFVWRRLKSRQWNAVIFDAVDAASPAQAFACMQRHLEKGHNSKLSEMVVDHYFYEITAVPGDDVGVHRSKPLSLRDFEHPFQFEFDNHVYSDTAHV